MFGGLGPHDPQVMGAAWTGIVAAMPQASTAFLLIFARLGAILMTLPAFSDDAVPGRIRLFIALAISAGLFPLLRDHVAAIADGAAQNGIMLARYLLTELLLGLALGLIVRLMFHSIVIAGGIISLQVGLTSAVIFDPSVGGQVPVLGKFISICALLLCMATGVHHLWLAGLVDSYARFPAGTIAPAGDFAQIAVMATTGAMALGLSLAAPLVIYAIVFNAALGLAARLAPQLQIFFIGQPLNLLLGLALTTAALAASLTGFADRMGAWTLDLWG